MSWERSAILSGIVTVVCILIFYLTEQIFEVNEVLIGFFIFWLLFNQYDILIKLREVKK